MITEQIKYLSSLSFSDLHNMYEDMQEVLDHNFNYFYGDFRSVIVKELVDNFKIATGSTTNYEYVIRKLSQ